MSYVLVTMIIPSEEYEQELKKTEEQKFKLLKPKVKKQYENILNLTKNEPLEKVVHAELNRLQIKEALWEKSENGIYYHVIFSITLEDSDFIIQHFKNFGIGFHLDSSIGIIPFTLYSYNEYEVELDEVDLQDEEKEFKDKQNKFLKSVTARLTVAQIVSSVRASAVVTFDFICYLIFGSWIAAMGLVENSVVSLVASMLVSPMMGPVLAICFGYIIKDKSLIKLGGKSILVCLLITVGFGFFFGLISFNFTDKWADWAWPTDMMRERGLLRGMWVGVLVAFPSGCAVAISLLSGNDASLVGVAISVSLLPPAVNAGLLWSYSLLKFLYSIGQEKEKFILHNNGTGFLPPALIPDPKYEVVYYDNVATETLIMGFISLILCIINISMILVGASLLLKIKEIAPLTTLSPESRRFFQEDIKIAREYNQKRKKSDLANEHLGEEFVQEWARLNGVNLGDLPEAQAVQAQTLADLAKDVELDGVFQHVAKNVHTENITRRMSHAAFNFPQRKQMGMLLKRTDSNRSSIRSTSSANFPGPITKRPSIAFPADSIGRRLSTIAIHVTNDNNSNGPRSCQYGYENTAFSFNELDVNNYLRGGRRGSAAMRLGAGKTLWPSTQNIHNPNRRPSHVVNENDATINSVSSKKL